MRHLRRTKDSLLTMTSAFALIAATVTIAAPARADDARDQIAFDRLGDFLQRRVPGLRAGEQSGEILLHALKRTANCA